MKKILVILLLSIFWLSCEKEGKEESSTKVISTENKYYRRANGKGE